MSEQAPSQNNTGETQVERLERQKLELELEIKKKELEAFGKPPAAPSKPWWAVAVELLGLPAAVLGLAVAFTTFSGNKATEQKTLAETAQIKASMEKAAEASKLAEDLSAKQKEGPRAFEQAVIQNEDKIRSALDRLRQVEDQAARLNMQRSVLKFVLLWILFSVIGLVFDIIDKAWNTATGAIMLALNQWVIRGDRRDGGNGGRRSQIFNRYAPPAFMVLGPLPSVLRWAIQLSIFAALLGPLFNEIGASFGSSVTFAAILREASHLQFSKMLTLMHSLLFGQ